MASSSTSTDSSDNSSHDWSLDSSYDSSDSDSQVSVASVNGTPTMEESKWTRDGFTIKDRRHYSESMNELCMSEIYSDLVLISQEGSKFPAHRAILAGRSDYFSALLYGGLRESGEKEVNVMCSAEALKIILTFLYSGEVLIGSSGLPFLMTLLSEARTMFLTNLQAAVEDLMLNEVKISNIEDGIELFNFGIETDFDNIANASRKYLEIKADEILNSVDYMQSFSAFSLKAFISGDDLDVPEIEIFRGVVKLFKNTEVMEEDKKAVLSEVRLDQMTNKQLMREVRPSGLFSETEVIKAIRLEERNGSSRKVFLNKNICLKTMGAKVIKGDPSPHGCMFCFYHEWSECRCMNPNPKLDVIIKGKVEFNAYRYVSSVIGKRLEIKLPSKQKVNKINILFHDKEANDWGDHQKLVYKDYSYKVESSLDGINWEIVADFSNYEGRSWQTIYFEEKRMKYIGIVGTKEKRSRREKRMRKDDFLYVCDTYRGYLHVTAVEAMLDTDTEVQDRKNAGMKMRS